MSLDTCLKNSGSVPSSTRPQPATVIGFPSGQTPQQAVLQIGGNGIGVTLMNPSRGVAGYEVSKRFNFRTNLSSVQTYMNCNHRDVEIYRASVIAWMQMVSRHEEQVTTRNAASRSTVKVHLASWCFEVNTVGGCQSPKSVDV